MGKFLRTIRFLILLALSIPVNGQPSGMSDLVFSRLPDRWDEGIPLGNGMLGALLWQRDSVLRISVDRADLWDIRPVKEFDLPQFRFEWVRQQWLKDTYDTVQELFDLPYERDPGPTKIPAGAFEIPIHQLGPVESVRLSLAEAQCTIRWRSGQKLQIFLDAAQGRGWFRFTGKTSLEISFDPPDYYRPAGTEGENSLNGQDLARLGYPPPLINRAEPGRITYARKGYDTLAYLVNARWQNGDVSSAYGYWEIVRPGKTLQDFQDSSAVTGVSAADFDSAFARHSRWWRNFWEKSSVSLPDTLLERQYYRELYKFGSASRKGAPPITLQAVWTADNGRLPPWKGDFHNDLNTQLSYWPGYTANHLEESSVFTDWIWANRGTAEKFTRNYFGFSGIGFPGVSTLTGEPMGGWIQYALSPTVSAWLAHHFYLQWRYSLDTVFLRGEAYPFIRGTAEFLDQMLVRKGKYRQLPLSSSPEFFDNSARAWFPEMTNFDLALVRWLFRSAAELARALDRKEEERRWIRILNDLPPAALSSNSGLMVAPGCDYETSHRHFSHLMGIYPLKLYDWHNSRADRAIISRSLNDLRARGSDYWCGYSYAWYGNLLASAGMGDSAASALRTFARCFCLPNSFHANGDQSGTGKSKFTYRPFTLEGNFAFAAGIQEMLLQSAHGVVRVFPAIPQGWKDVSYCHLRAEGAFLVSASRKNGKTERVEIFSEKGGMLVMENPFRSKKLLISGTGSVKLKKGNLYFRTSRGQKISIEIKKS